jgi:hypothetical protein
MRKSGTFLGIVLFLIILVIAGCNFGGSGGALSMEEAVHAGVQATLTKEAWLEGVESARKTAIAAENLPTATADGSGADVRITDTPYPTPQATLTPTLKAAGDHLLVPGKPKERVDTYLIDYNSSDYAAERITYGDNYKANILERPFTANEMDYLGAIDIIRANMKVTTTSWIYVIIFLAEDLPDEGAYKYGLELDLDENGRGDFLIQTGIPTSLEWTVSGVQVYQDLDHDVGGSKPMFPDHGSGRTGYETLLFDSGEGDDPDLVWVRRDPETNNQFQFAIKYDLIGNTGFMWSVWADGGLKAPDYFDYQDLYNEETAGSPYPGSPLYPIKSLAMFDNTCRSYYGFTPNGNEPGLCQ